MAGPETTIRKHSKTKPEVQSEDNPDPAHVALCLDIIESLWRQESTPSVASGEKPLDGLIRTVLSQNTNDLNRDRAYERLRRLYPTWEDVLEAEIKEIAEAIKSAGISNIKAGRIKTILETVEDVFGKLNLDELKEWDHISARDFLQNLPGVGPKTAACVLLFNLDMPAFPVDTHVSRVSRRIGWFPPSASAESIQASLEEIIPPKRHLGAHLNLILHGKNICRSRKPECARCPIRHLCLTGKETAGF